MWNITLFLAGCSLYVAGAIWVVHRHNKKARRSETLEQEERGRQESRVQAIESTLRSVDSTRLNRAGSSGRDARQARRRAEVSEARRAVEHQKAPYDVQHETVSAAARRARIDNLV